MELEPQLAFLGKQIGQNQGIIGAVGAALVGVGLEGNTGSNLLPEDEDPAYLQLTLKDASDNTLIFDDAWAGKEITLLGNKFIIAQPTEDNRTLQLQLIPGQDSFANLLKDQRVDLEQSYQGYFAVEEITKDLKEHKENWTAHKTLKEKYVHLT